MKIIEDLQQLTGGDVTLIPDFLDRDSADRLFDSLFETLAWEQKSIRMFGKWTPMPRLTCWYGDPGASYTYSGLTERPLPWTPELTEIHQRLQTCLAISFNSVLANLYRTGKDAMGWHSDNERELGPEPVIASVSLGAERRFDLQDREEKSVQTSIFLPHGSLLVMQGHTQNKFRHRLPASNKIAAARINLTYRSIVRLTAKP